MKNLLKLSAIAGISFAMVVFGACGGGSGGGKGGYTVTVNGTAHSATGSFSGTTNGNGTFTVMNGSTYVRYGTETAWTLYTPVGTGG